jgi:hypothetical protein
MQANSADVIRSFAAREFIEPARRKGWKRVQLVAGDVHRGLKLRNRVPNVCTALASKIFLEKNRLVIEAVSGPPSGMGTRVIYTYRLLDDEGGDGTAGVTDFRTLRGLLKTALDSIGGGDAFLRREREQFYHPDKGGNK